MNAHRQITAFISSVGIGIDLNHEHDPTTTFHALFFIEHILILAQKYVHKAKKAGIGKEGRVLIESECVCSGCWSAMGWGPSWLPLQRPNPPVSSAPAAG